MVKHVTSEELEELIKGDKPVVCDFWATWCGPCRMLAPVFEAVSEKFADKAVFVKVDVDENEAAARKYGISSIPDIILFRDGKAGGGKSRLCARSGACGFRRKESVIPRGGCALVPEHLQGRRHMIMPPPLLRVCAFVSPLPGSFFLFVRKPEKFPSGC